MDLRGGVLLAMMTSLDLPLRRVFSVCLYPSTYLPEHATGKHYQQAVLWIPDFYSLVVGS